MLCAFYEIKYFLENVSIYCVHQYEKGIKIVAAEHKIWFFVKTGCLPCPSLNARNSGQKFKCTILVASSLALGLKPRWGAVNRDPESSFLSNSTPPDVVLSVVWCRRASVRQTLVWDLLIGLLTRSQLRNKASQPILPRASSLVFNLAFLHLVLRWQVWPDPRLSWQMLMLARRR